jgi:hypothetical protein
MAYRSIITSGTREDWRSQVRPVWLHSRARLHIHLLPERAHSRAAGRARARQRWAGLADALMSGTMKQVTDRAGVSRCLAGYEAAWRAAGTRDLAGLFTGDAAYLQSPTNSLLPAWTRSSGCGRKKEKAAPFGSLALMASLGNSSRAAHT